jgi:hypothetical protein
LRLAAAAAGVGNVGLVAIGANVDLDRLAARLQARSMGAAGQNAPGAAGGPAAYGHPEHGLPVCHVKPFAPHNASLNGGGTGVILVSPMKLKKAELRDTSHLLSVTPFPVLGLITHTSRRSRRRSPQLAPSLDQR